MKFTARSKYHARPALVDGIRFASQAESRRYVELKLLQKAGQILGLIMQPSFDLLVNDAVNGGEKKVGVYRADFRYTLPNGAVVTEDIKSKPTRTAVYRLKKKIVEALYGITITEVMT